MESKKTIQNKIRLSDIPLDSCKIFTVESKKLAVCHEPNGDYSLFELTPIGVQQEKRTRPTEKSS